MLPFREHGPHDARVVFLLLHFFGGSHREWDGVVPVLSTQYRVVAADMAGFGEATALEGFSVAQMAARVRELVEYCAPAQVVLVGHSMSGKAAMVVASDPPANLGSLALLGPSPLSGEPMSDSAREAMTVANTSRDRAEKFTRNGIAGKLPEDLFEIAVEDVLRTSDEAMHAWPGSGTREDWSDRVKRLRVKTLLLVGDSDEAISPEVQAKETLPLVQASGGRMVMLNDAGHLLPYEKPLEVARLLLHLGEEIG